METTYAVYARLLAGNPRAIIGQADQDTLGISRRGGETVAEAIERAAGDEGTRECQGHSAGPYDPMGQTVFCDGSCLSVRS